MNILDINQKEVQKHFYENRKASLANLHNKEKKMQNTRLQMIILANTSTKSHKAVFQFSHQETRDHFLSDIRC